MRRQAPDLGLEGARPSDAPTAPATRTSPRRTGAVAGRGGARRSGDAHSLPPGIPAAPPGERLNRAVVDCLHSGVAAGMVVPDAADPKLDSVRVVIER